MKEATLFSAPWCAPCKPLKAIWNAIALEYGGVSFRVIDAESDPQDAIEAGVSGFPTLVYYDRGSEVSRHIGACTEGQIRKQLEGLLNID